MKINFDFKGDFNSAEKWLDSVVKGQYIKPIEQAGKEGVNSLKRNTPKDTGETSEGWVSIIEQSKDITEISWKNVAHPENRVNLAKLLDMGYTTGTGGFVPPRPYIKKSMDPVYDSAIDKVVKELNKL